MTTALLSALTGLVAFIGGWFGIEQVQNFGAFGDPFVSVQLAANPSNGNCLTTNGTDNAWGACGSGGSGSFPFSADTNYGQQVYSTSTPTIWLKSGVFASSTSRFVFASTTSVTASDTASSTKLVVSGSTQLANSLTGLAYTSAGAVSAITNGTIGSTGVLGLSAGVPAYVATSTLYGAGSTPGYVLGFSNGVWTPTATATCAQITGSADLCDGDDATGGAGGSFPFTPGLNPTRNSTSTLIQFTQGIISNASSTIGGGTETTGLTISGAATTTGTIYGGGYASALPAGITSPAAFLTSSTTGRSGMILGNNGSGAAPEYRFVVYDPSNISEYIAFGLTNQNATAGGTLWGLNKTDIVYLLSNTGRDMVIGPASANNLYLAAGDSTNAPDVTLSGQAGTNGYLGIGTTSPYAALSVVGPTGVVAEKFHATSSSATSVFAGSISLGGVSGNSWDDFCVTITGHAGLCDGIDDTGSGGAGTVSTSTTPTKGQLAYWTSSAAWPETLGSVATGTISDSGLIGVTAGQSVIGSGLTISLDNINANTVIGNNTGASAAPTAFATSSLFAAGTAGHVLTYSNGLWVPMATATCLQITGSADLCDGNDASGAGASFPFTAYSWGNATGTVIGFEQGLIANASSTFAGNVDVDGVLIAESGSTNNPAIVVGGTAGGPGIYLDSADTLGLSNGLTGDVQLNASAFSPDNNNVLSLGENNLAWSDLYLGNTKKIDFAAGDVTLTHSSSELTVSAGDRLNFTFGSSTSFTASDTASTTRLVVSGSTQLANSLTGLAYTSAGAVSAITNGTIGSTGVLGLSAGVPAYVATSTLFGAGSTPGFILGFSNGVWTPMATATCVQITGHAGLCDGDDATGAGGGSYPFTPMAWNGTTTSATTSPIWLRTGFMASSTSYIDNASSTALTLSDWVVSTTTTVCAFNCEYSSIQTALNAGHKDIVLKAENYAGPVSIISNDTTIRGAGLYNTTISCAGGVCVSIATTSALTRITLEDFGIDSTSAGSGIGLDTSMTSNVYAKNIRITDFNLGHLVQDGNAQNTFYHAYENMVYFDNNSCFRTASTTGAVTNNLVNANSMYTSRCRVAASDGVGYDILNSEGWTFYSPNAEPGSVIGTGMRIDGNSMGITVVTPWFESNATGTEIQSGAANVKFVGGRITANTRGVWDRGTRTSFDNTLITSNTTNVDVTGNTTIGIYTNSDSAYSGSFMAIGSTTRKDAHNRLALGISTSESTASALVINNSGAFATSPAAIEFTNSTGGFSHGTARIAANPGSGYAAPTFTIQVSDAAKALQTRLTIDAAGLLTFTHASSTNLTVGSYFQLPNATSITNNTVASLAVDTTSGNLLLGTSTGSTRSVVIGGATTTLYAFAVASTSPDFVSGGIIDLPSHFLAQTVTAIWCKVDSGTSQQIFISDGTNDTNTITCTTTGAQYPINTNANFTAGEAIRVEFVTKSGSPDYITVRALGYRTSD